MTLSIRCPKCKAVHRVGDEMAGQRAKCRCGAVIVVPSRQQAPAQPRAQSAPTAASQGSVVVRCPGCGRTHKASASMAGTSARCTCGTVMKIPAAQQPTPTTPAAAPARSTIWDELNEDQWAVIAGKKPRKEEVVEEESASPGAALYGGSATKGGLWRDGKKLVCSSNAHFPGRCVKSNQPTNNRVQKTLSYCPPWAYILFGALIAIAFTRRMKVEFAMEPRWATRRMIHVLIGLGVALLGFLILCIAGAVMGSSEGGIAGLIGAVFFFMGIVSMFGGLLYSCLGGRTLWAVYIDDMKEHAWLKGAHPDFLASLPQWGGQHY